MKRVMVVAKRSDGSLVVHNAIGLDDAAMKELESLGSIKWIIVPNGYHRIDAAAFHARYPDAKVLCPRGARAKVEKVVPVDGTYEDFSSDDDIRFQDLPGMNGLEGAMIVRSKDGVSVVLTDAVFNMPHVGGFSGFVLRHLTQSTGGPRVSRIARLFLVKDKRAFRSALEELAAIPNLRRVIVAHHLTIDRDPANVLREVAATL